MKSLIILSLLFSAQVMANDSQTLRACKSDEIKELIYDQNKDMQSKYMQNSKGEIVGVYSWEEGAVYAEVCEYINSDMTVANEWYYWQNDDESSNPAKWLKGDSFEIAQDEGLANITVLKGSKKGDVSFRFEIIGWDGEGEQHTLKNEVLSLRSL